MLFGSGFFYRLEFSHPNQVMTLAIFGGIGNRADFYFFADLSFELFNDRFGPDVVGFALGCLESQALLRLCNDTRSVNLLFLRFGMSAIQKDCR